MKASLDVLAAPESLTGLSRSENIRATYCVFREECEEIVACLKSYHDAALTRRHRDARRLVSELHGWCGSNDLVAAGVDPAMELGFVQGAVRFLKDFHRVMVRRK